MNLRTALCAFGAAILASVSAYAQETTEAAATLLPESLNLEIVDGSSVPEDCMYPETVTDTSRFELACVTMPRFASGDIGARYIGQLGTAGWHQGVYISGGMTAVKADENGCERVLNIFPADFPPGDEDSASVVLWFALDRQPRCNGSAPG